MFFSVIYTRVKGKRGKVKGAGVRGGESATKDRHWGPDPQPPCDKRYSSKEIPHQARDDDKTTNKQINN